MTPEIPIPDTVRLLGSRRDPAQSITELTQFLLRGSDSLSESERELIARVVPNGDQCLFSTNEKMQALLTIAAAVKEGSMLLKPELTNQAKMAGATDVEIHDTVLLAVLFV